MTKGPRAALIALAIFAGPVACDAATFRVATDQTTVAFAVSNFGIGCHEGRFDLTSGKIVLDPERRSGSIEFVVDVGSVDTGWESARHVPQERSHVRRPAIPVDPLPLDSARVRRSAARRRRRRDDAARRDAAGSVRRHADGVRRPHRRRRRRLRSVGARAHLAQRVRDAVRLSARRRRGRARFLDQGDSRARRRREGIRRGDQRGRGCSDASGRARRPSEPRDST